jgi:hypothetical protein
MGRRWVTPGPSTTSTRGELRRLGAEILEEPLAVAQQDRYHGEIELVEQPGGEGRCTTFAPPARETSASPAAFLARSSAASIPGHKVERRAALHLERFARGA